MRVKNLAFSVWSKFHLTIIVIISIYYAYDSYCEFYSVKKNAHIKKVISAVLLNKPVTWYSRVTGAGSGYGFFAPNVRSTGLIIGECDGRKITANFKNSESAVRFSALSTRSTDYLLQSDNRERDDPFRALEEQFYDLVFKNISVRIFNENKCLQDTFYVSYNLLEFPSLKEYRSGDHDYHLIRIKELRLTKGNE